MMDLQTRSRRNRTYVLWMLGTALIPVGLGFRSGSFLQFLFIGIGIALFVLSHVLYRKAWGR
ncbi:MAG: hypothetical protein MUC48_09725 [Leptolyngbya sp. Prado105]|nr:hypothetical protein [Leptolyngbya sp. Prado105]